jgi:2-polyprenyl-3-methyl-5-hydroxy-6-metoxy-1,4-benzoquinol methylase
MTPCPLCGAPTEAAFTTRDRNRAVSDESFRYRRCTACGSLHLENVPADLGPYYPADYFSLPDLDGLRAQAVPERWRMELLRAHVAPPGRLTEIGPGNGIFAVQALDAGFEVAAIEVDESACAYLRDVVGVDVVRSAAPEQALEGMAPSRAVAMWHVLEHVGRPWDVLDAAAGNLEPGGVLVVATPNPRALGFRMMGARWPHVDAPRHLFLLDHEALIARAAAAGLALEALTDRDPGGLHWNAFAYHFLLRRPGISPTADKVAHLAGQILARALAPVERRGLRGAAYTAVFRKGGRSNTSSSVS